LSRRTAPRSNASRDHGVGKSADPVADYYDASTRRFLLVGGSGGALAIHRALWAEGIATTEAAANHINTVIRDETVRLKGRAPDSLRDLGCGVGGSIFALARDWPDTAFLGLTISSEQHARAEAEAKARDLSDRCRFLCADFTAPSDGPQAEVAIAVESHVHAESAETFLRAAAGHLRPGGLLLIVDDMLARPEAELSTPDRRRLDSFRAGWRLGHVPDIAGLIAAAEAQGFTHEGTRNLTPLIRLNRLRDIALRLAGPVAERLGLQRAALFSNMIGGNALTESYRRGVMRYAMVCLRLRGG
jgi:cyclopropane fatty-acyl-phospholipid synthase-like methyltransferase